MPQYSVLIPTYNRKEKLIAVLEALRNQHGIEKGEVIIGIDGSNDGTEQYLQENTESYPFDLTFFAIPNSGRAVIRNRLIEKASGDLLIFIQDDIIVTENWLQAHLRAQKNHEGAVVGYVSWYPGMPITPYMKWLENGGHMLDFRGLKDGQELSFWRFYMGNISLPRKQIASLRFDEDMKHYGWEDIVFGYRFLQGPHKVYYAAEAKAYHWDEYREEELKSYMEQVGKSAVLAGKKYPEVGFVPPAWKWKLYQAMIASGRMVRSVLPERWKWYLDMKQWFLEACAEEMSDKNLYKNQTEPKP